MNTGRSFGFWVLIGMVIFGCLLLIPRVRHTISFAFAFMRSPKQVGSLVPSSRFLAREMVKPIEAAQGGIRVLEVGAGTGAFTDEILEKLQPNDQLDVIEYDPELCALLGEKLKAFSNATLYCTSILDWQPAHQYEVIISSLPFNVFSATDVQKILDRYRVMLAPGGSLSYIEYLGASWVALLFCSAQEQENRNRIQELVTQFRSEYDVTVVRVWLNIPPTYVYHLKKKN